MNKKFDILTILIVVVTLTVLSIFAFLISSLGKDIGAELRDTANEMNINQKLANESTEFLYKDVPHYGDNYVFWFFVATFIGLILTAMFLEFEPAMMIIILIFGSIAVLGAWLGSSITSEVIADASISETANLMTKTKFIMSNHYFPIFIFIGLVVMMVVMYSKKRQGEYQ